MNINFLSTLQLTTFAFVSIFIVICLTDTLCSTYVHIRQMYRQRYLHAE